MPRPIIGIPQASAGVSARSRIESQNASRTGLSGAKLQQRLRQKRSSAYIDIIGKIDAGAYQSDRAAFDSLLEAISDEFPELRIDELPLGIVSKCYLGAPFEVHICDLSGEILKHFEAFRSMPPPFERSRSLAIHPAYAFVEVYSDTLRAIAPDGSVSVIEK